MNSAVTLEQIPQVVLDVVTEKLSAYDEQADETVLDEKIAQLPFDSLDSLEVTHELERRLHVQTDAATVAAFETYRDYVPYLQSLVESSWQQG
ncbi:acyl carrier protein [Micromonospora sp. DT48]|uniref:acyl carrier protein n=1 Tax=unclassified Micromonospora TaxID=2617518 RepID=UPI0012BD6C4F|nr:acyl carrier protein [Micromonospora sp. CP22]MTK01195.1 acyl carrier protein [Micromonospora sp. CP22]